MKIWIDLRFIWNNPYSEFILELVKALTFYDPDNSYTLYVNTNSLFETQSNIQIKNVSIQPGSIQEQIQFLKILNKDNNDLMLFLGYSKPLFYKKLYHTLVASLKDIYYQNFSSYIAKYKYLFLLERNLKWAKKVICFDTSTKEELVERMNLSETSIFYLTPFFMGTDLQLNSEEKRLDVNTKYTLTKPYIIYSGWNGIEKNLDRLMNTFARLQKQNIELDLVLMWDEISKDISLRNSVIKYGIQSRVHFLWDINKTEEKLIYAGSVATIFPSLYEPFPFEIAPSLFAQKPILVSKLKQLENIFWEDAYYYSPISSNSILEVIKSFLSEKKKKQYDLQKIKNTYNIEKSISDIREIINNA